MNKKDILELRKRLKKNECTFTRLCGCYVDCEKNIVLKLNETFLNLIDEEFYKYLEIAKKTLSGTIGNNLLELDFPLQEEQPGGKQQFLMGLKESRLKNEALLDNFYQLIIDSYDYAGNYLILLYHDAYDVMTKTSDNSKLDESEEVYDYLICAICPVTLTKAGLGYLEDENRIGPRNRDWVVNAPDIGFVFPAFTDRSTDIHSIMYYTKDGKEPHAEFMEEGLGCPSKQTATEQKETFKSIIKNALGIEDEKNNHLFLEIQETLNTLVDEHEERSDDDSEPVLLTNDSIQEILIESGVPEEISEKIEKTYTEKFGDTPPAAEYLIDTKALAAHAQKKRERELTKQVMLLQEKLESKSNPTSVNNADLNANLNVVLNAAPVTNEELDIIQETPLMEEKPSVGHADVVLRVKPEKVTQIKSQIIDGKKCLVIPLDEDEHANVNGINTLL